MSAPNELSSNSPDNSTSSQQTANIETARSSPLLFNSLLSSVLIYIVTPWNLFTSFKIQLKLILVNGDLENKTRMINSIRRSVRAICCWFFSTRARQNGSTGSEQFEINNESVNEMVTPRKQHSNRRGIDCPCKPKGFERITPPMDQSGFKPLDDYLSEFLLPLCVYNSNLGEKQ